MTLTTRVSAFFLATLAAVLGVYSLVFYSVARRDIEQEFDNELTGVLHSLVAAAEVEDTVKWQPLEHSIALGSNDQFGEILWMVVGNKDLIVEQSQNMDQPFEAEALRLASASTTGESATNELTDEHQHRLFLSRHLAAPRRTDDDESDDDVRQPDEFDELLIVVGRSTVERDQTLARLWWLVMLVPLAAWLITALFGQWIVRQALRPVRAMSEQASSIAGTDFRTRLQVDTSKDELAELGTAFNRLLDRQQVAFDQQRRFAGDAAHELRTPLTVLLGQIDVTLRRTRTEEEYQSNLQLLRQQASALQEIVESLLYLARTDEEALLPQLEAISLNHWLAQYDVSRFDASRQADVEFVNDLTSDACVRAAPSLLARVLDNLVSNALKYSTSGTPVVVKAVQSDTHVEISVTDAGCGIADRDLESLFDPFFRTSEARSAGIAGTGLGLAIAHRIATALRGSLKCQSQRGQGSCFTLRLPLL